VTMVPKRKQIREALARLDLWVLRSTLLLDAMRMTFANGDTKMMSFDEVVPNAALEPGTFSIER
jgi:tRNA splicing endonuclease